MAENRLQESHVHLLGVEENDITAFVHSLLVHLLGLSQLKPLFIIVKAYRLGHAQPPK